MGRWMCMLLSPSPTMTSDTCERSSVDKFHKLHSEGYNDSNLQQKACIPCSSLMIIIYTKTGGGEEEMTHISYPLN